MSETTALRAPALSSLEGAIVAAVAYSDVFDYPLTLDELQRNLTVAASLAAVEAALRAGGGLVSRLIDFDAPYYHLAGRESVVATRRRRSVSSTRLLAQATRWGAVIARLPFVRMVALTGSLAVANAEADDDIDYLIVTAPGRVWLARALTIGVVRLAALRGVRLCPNYLLSSAALSLPAAERNLYSARELLQMRVVAGQDVAAEMLQSNSWWREYLPNGEPRNQQQATSNKAGIGGLSSGLVACCWLPVASLLERLCYRKARELQRQAVTPEAVFTPDVCKGHLEGHRGRLENALASRLRDLGVDAT